jgi:enterochelin esterase-like enzyme
MTRLTPLPALLLLVGVARADVHDLTYPSKQLGQDVPIKVYTPPGYETGTDRYPVVYNLHGGGGSPERQWDRTRKALTDAMDGRKVRPMIYVYANGLGNTEFVNTADGKPIERSIVTELVPFVDGKYRTVAGKHGRAIDGFSMGGWGCLSVAFRNPDLFCAVVSYGGALSIGPDGRNYRDKAHHAEHDPNALARAKADVIRTGLRVRVVCGEDDEKWYPSNVKFKDLLGELKVPCDWVPVKGVGHDTKGLYDRVGLDSLKFIEESFIRAARAGRVEDRTFRSKLNDRDVTVKVYTPPGYDAGADRYPVVYNLHGAGGGSPQRQWDRVRKTLTGAMDGKQVRPMIYVFVDGLGDTFFIDYATGSPKVESMIVTELIPWVDANYRTVAGRHGRAADGFSMGGFGCLMLAFRHPDKFCAVVSYGAALIDPGEDKTADKKDPRAGRWGDKAYADKYNPRSLARANADAIRDGLRVRVVCGDKDGLYERNVTFKKLLDELKIPVDWVPVEGVAHDTKGLYDRVGVESLKFVEKAYDAAAK